jgi:hypothetical protein
VLDGFKMFKDGSTNDLRLAVTGKTGCCGEEFALCLPAGA